MEKKFLTDEQVEIEIERLRKSPMVKLGRKEQQIRNRRRQYMYTLRNFEKKGKELVRAGITMDVLYRMEEDDDE